MIAYRKDRRTSEQRSAFTIVELLVVLVVIGVLMSIIIPAVMSARGAANRLDCENRLRQFGVALHNFESNHRHLPVGTIFVGGGPAGTDWKPAQIQLLPYLEQASLYEKLIPNGQVARDVRIPAFHCPTEEVREGISYRVCTGLHVGCTEMPNQQFTGTLSRGFGALPGRSSLNPLSLGDITDGLSNTVAMSERTISFGPANRFDKGRDIWISGAASVGFSIDARTTDEAVAVCASLNYTPTTSFTPFAGRNLFGMGSVSTCYNHALPPNSDITDCAIGAFQGGPMDAWYFDECGIAVAARSRHFDRTVNILLMDGSVRTIPPNVDLEAWRSLASRADGDVAF